MQFPVFEHARWLADAWRHGEPDHDLGASGFLPDDPLEGLPTRVEAADVGHMDLHAGTGLRDALAAHLGMGPEAVRVTAGTSAANTAAIATLVRPGDQVVCERPTYMPLPQVAQGLGAGIAWVETWDEEVFDAAAFDEACSDSTSLILVTSPNNPTGHALTAKDLRALGDVAASYGARVLVDQVYRELTDHALGAAVHDHVLSTGGFNKCWGAPGLRVGWVAGDDIGAIEETHRLLCLAPPSFGTRMATALLADASSRRAALETRLERTHVVYEAWCRDRGWPTDHGAMVAFPRVGGDTMALARSLLEAGILTVPGELFGKPGHLRIGLGIREDKLAAGLDALAAALDRRAAQRL